MMADEVTKDDENYFYSQLCSLSIF